MKDFLKQYFLPGGRIGRKSFLFRCFAGLLSLIIVYIIFVLSLKLLYSLTIPVTVLVVWKITMGMILLFSICSFWWFLFCQATQRIHDLDKWSFVLLILLIIPFINVLVLLYLLLVKWTIGPNKYWPDPLEKTEVIPVA